MTTEYQRLGGHLPHELQAIIKEYSMPRYMKPIPQVVAQIKAINRDGGVKANHSTHPDYNGNFFRVNSCYIILLRAKVLASAESLKRKGKTKFHGPF